MKKQTTPFELYIREDQYAVETLINGNITECIKYLKGLIDYGLTGIMTMHDELINIKEKCPDRYDYIRKRVFSL